jgi:hypothetical protein
MVPYSAQIRTRAERKSSQMERAHLLWSYDCRQVDVLKLITEGRWSTGRVTIEVVEDPLENKSVGDPPAILLLLPGTQTLGSGYG